MIKAIVSTLTLLILDGIFLGLIAKKLYLTEIGNIMRLSQGSLHPLWIPVVIVYAMLILGILFFVIPKAEGIPLHALLWGALFGLITYGVYDFTNLAILTNWTLKISIIDTLWGMTLCGITSFVTVLITQ